MLFIPRKQHVEARNEHHAKQRPDEHAARRRRADGAVAHGARARGNAQRNQTGHEGERRHQNGPQAGTGALHGGIEHRGALLAAQHGEFDDKDGVFAEQTDEHHQRNLGVDVVFEPKELEGQEGPEDASGQAQDDRQRQSEALVLGRQQQIHE